MNDDITTLDEAGLEFIALNPDGEETTYEALFTYDSDETGKSYIAYTDNEVDDETGEVSVYASTYDPQEFDSDVAEGIPVDLKAIATDAEWDMIEDLLSEYNELQGAYDEDDSEDEDLDDEDGEDEE